MIPRGLGSALVVGAVALILLGSLLSRLTSETRRADRANARADSLATEILLERARADGWEATAADTTTVLLELLAATDSQAATLARELEAVRARPVSRTVLVASSSGAARAQRDPEASAADSTVYLVDDGPLSGVITTWADSALARLDWSIEISAELVHVEGPDRRLLVFARSPDPRVRLTVPEFVYQLPEPARQRFPWKWIGGAAVGGYLLGRAL